VPERSFLRYVVYVVAEVLFVVAAAAGILMLLSPLVGLGIAVALVVIVVLVAVIVALLLYPKPLKASSATPPPVATSGEVMTGRSGRYYIERNGMLFVVEMTERAGPSGEPLAGVVGLPLCPKDRAQMIQAGDETDWLQNVVRRNWRCPNGDSTGYTSYGPPEDTLATVRALAVGRWHNAEPFDPPLRERPKPPSKSAAPRGLVRPNTERPARESTPTGKASLPPPEKPRVADEQIVTKVVEVRDVASVRLPLKKGDQVYGHLREEESLDFSWFIVDLENLGLMERGEEYEAEEGEEDVPNATVNWTAPSDDPWFLAFDAYRKQYIRNVAVELWRRPSFGPP